MADQFGTNGAELKTMMILDQADFDKAIDNIIKKVKGVQKEFDQMNSGTNGSGNAFKNMANQASQAGEKIKKSGKNAKETGSDFDEMAKKIESVGKSFDKIGDKMTKKLTVPLTALAGLSIKTASDVQEMEAMFEYVFGSSSDEVEKWADNLSDKLNRSSYDIKDSLSSLYNLYNAMGAPTDQAIDFSKSLSELAIHMGSFYNKADADVLNDFTSGLMGESTSLKKYSIVINEAMMKQEHFNSGVNKSYEELTELEKVILRTNIILKSSGDAWGAAERESENFASQLKGLQASLKDLAVAFGEEMLPIATEIVKSVREWVDGFADLDDSTKQTIIKVGLLVIAMGPLFKTIGTIATAVGALKTAFIGLSGTMITAYPIMVALGGAIALGTQAWSDYKETVDSVRKAEEARMEIQDRLSTGGNFEDYREEAKRAIELAQEINRLKQSGGFAVAITGGNEEGRDVLGVNLPQQVQVIKQYGKSVEELGISEEERQQIQAKLLELTKEYNDIVYTRFDGEENLNKVIKELNDTQAKSVEIKKEVLTIEQQLANIQAGSKANVDYLNNLKEEASLINKNNSFIKEAIDAYRNLSTQQNISEGDLQSLAQLQQYLTTVVGDQLFVLNKQSGMYEINEQALIDYNKQLALVSAQARNKIQVQIETVITTKESEVNNIQKEIERVQTEIKDLNRSVMLDGDGAITSSVLQNKTNAKLKELEKYSTIQKELQATLDAEKKTAEEAQKAVAENAVKQIQDVFKNIGTSTANYNKQIETQTQNAISSELRLLDYRYNTEQITQQQMLEGLKSNLTKYANYYKEHLTEELSLREQIFEMEREMQQELEEEKIELLEKANQSILDDLEKRRSKEEEAHKARIKQIENEKDTQLKAIRAVVEERENALNTQRAEDRIAEINSVIDVYRQSSTSDGQERYKELLREREDLELDLMKDSIRNQEAIIEANYNQRIETENVAYDSIIANIEKESEIIEGNFNDMLNKITNTSTEITAEMDKIIQTFKDQLLKGVQNALTEVSSSPISSTVSAFSNNGGISEIINKLSQPQTFTTDFSMSPPKDALNSFINNTINQNFNIVIEGGNVSGEQASTLKGEIAKAAWEAMKEVLR